MHLLKHKKEKKRFNLCSFWMMMCINIGTLYLTYLEAPESLEALA